MKKAMSLALALCMVFTFCAVAASADWTPTKTVDFIVPFNAGGSSDMFARIFANQGAKYFATDFVVLNEGGGSCSIGLTDLITRKPDGYSIGICNNGVPTLPVSMETPFIYKDEIDALCMWGIAPYVVIVNANSPYNTLGEMMDAIKANPNGLISGACGAGSQTHIEMEMLAYMVDSDIKSIAFDGGSAAIADLLGNNIDVTVQTPADCKQYLESGDLKCLAVLSSERLKGEIFKDIPTAIEQGYDLVSECYQGCGAAKGQDPEVIAYYEKCFQEALADSEVQAAIENMGFEVLYEDHATYQARWESTAESFATILETLGDRLIIA